ncbi:MAG: NADPH-dependent glutamate synthase [Candidatus Geothermincolia bacterium]
MQEKAHKRERTAMPEQPADERINNFGEVALGYGVEEGMREAERCLRCKKAPCVKGCPVEVDIPAFIERVQLGDLAGAIAKIKEKNNLPGICGRVCPQEDQCEKLCTLGKKGEPVAIGRLERLAADSEGEVEAPAAPEPNGKRVAVVGAGPAGLTCAGDLARMGYGVTVFEGLHAPGGVLTYGIPEFRLPKAVVSAEVDYIRSLGAEIRYNQLVGRTVKLDRLLADGYDAAFIGIGAGLPWFMDIPGENLNGVYSANEYLTRANLMKAYLFPEYDTPIKRGKRVAVVGGGNVALDSARTGLRLGAEEVFLVYRRSREEMPARAEEIHHALEEGVQAKFLTLPVRINGRDGKVVGMECLRMELGEPDESGRRRPVPIEHSEFTIECDVVVMAIGTSANPLLTGTLPELRLNRRGYIEVDPETGETSMPGVYAGGDIVTGSATVIEAMGAGKLAAKSIHRRLSGEEGGS